MTQLDLSNTSSLKYLNCGGNQITSLNLSASPDLENIIAYGNIIPDLDISNNANLLTLDCSNNNITNLNISVDTFFMTNLNISDNQLTSLNLSHFKHIDTFFCSGNQLNCLNIKNGSNAFISHFNALSNPSLSCIEVDDSSWAVTNWTANNGCVDSNVIFSNNCNNACSSPFTALQSSTYFFNLYPNPFSMSTTIDLPLEPHTLTIYDIVGNKVRQEQGSGTTTIERGDLTKGVYLLDVRSDNQTYSGKLIVE